MPDFCGAINLYSINWDDSGWLQYFHILFPSIKTFFPHIILKWSHIKINKDQWELLYSLGYHCGFVYDLRKVFKSWCGGNVKVTTSLWVLYCFLHRDSNIGDRVWSKKLYLLDIYAADLYEKKHVRAGTSFRFPAFRSENTMFWNSDEDDLHASNPGLLVWDKSTTMPWAITLLNS